MSDQTAPELVAELVALLGTKLSLLSPAHTRAAVQFLGALTGSVSQATETGAGDEQEKDTKPNPIYCQKGRKFYAKWHSRVMLALAQEPLTRDGISAAIKEVHGTCIPPFSISHLLHLMWSRGLVECVPQESDTGRTYIAWQLADAPQSTPIRGETIETPKSTRARKISWNIAEVVEWAYERLDREPGKYMLKTDIHAEAIAEGIPQELIQRVGMTAGAPRMFAGLPNWQRGERKTTYWIESDENGRQINRDPTGAIIANTK
jgi:hypothetical protein